MGETVSTIFIDFGSKNTGVVLAHGKAEEAFDQWDRRAYVITAGSGKQYAQTERRAKRHQKRNIERRYMAKRLLRLILCDHFKFTADELNGYTMPNQTFEQFVMGLLNRRGFTFAADEKSSEALNSMDFTLFASICQKMGLVVDGVSMKEHIGELALKDNGVIRSILEHEIFNLNRRGANVAGESLLQQDQKADFKKTLKAYEDVLLQILREEEDGHKPRTVYLREMRSFAKSNLKFCEQLTKRKIEVDSLLNIIGNISNLQLRPLRKYFNDPSFKIQDRWVSEKLFRILERYVRSFHINSAEERRRRDAFARVLEASNRDPIIAFSIMNPDDSIPPFEDQNNRRPQKCQSLLLDAHVLQKRYPQWQEWVRRISSQHSYLRIGSPDSAIVDEPTRILQRFMERSREIDKFSLRKLANSEDPHSLSECQELGLLIGKSSIDTFLEFARHFYLETGSARRSIWASESPMRLLHVCAKTTPARKNVRDLDIARVLRIADPTDLVTRLKKVLEINPLVRGRSKLKGVLESCADLQKKLQQDLKEAWQSCVNEGDKPNFIDVGDWRLLALVKPAAVILSEELGAKADSISNPWSLAQIHQILTSSDGHSKVCRTCGLDNFWRVMPADNGPDQDDTVANGVALPADSVRPFDGVIERLINDQADRIAKLKIDQLSETDAVSTKIFLILEENAFSSTEEMLEFKKAQGFSNPRRPKLEQQLDAMRTEVEARFASRTERLKDFSGSSCPYLGEVVGSMGEIDHILPRSYTLSRFGAVLNHEANLIFVSQRGNQAKGASIYSIGNINRALKHKHFPGCSDFQIEETVKRVVDELIKSRRINLQFALLKPAEQVCLRFSLFFESLRTKILPILIQSNRVRVNGTQRFLAKTIKNKLLEHAKNKFHLEVIVRFADANESSSIRESLGRQEARLQKKANQPLYSHVIDAMIGGLNMIADQTNDSVASALKSGGEFMQALPSEMIVCDLVAKPRALRFDTFGSSAFKAGMYAERFIPVWLTAEGAAIGFREDQLVIIPKGRQNEFWSAVGPLLRGKDKIAPNRDLTIAMTDTLRTGRYFTVDKAKYFELANGLANGNYGTESTFELECCEAVELLRFFVRKANFFATVWGERDLQPSEFSDIEKKLKIRFKGFGVDSFIWLPAAEEWRIALNKLKSANLPERPGRELKNQFRELGHAIFRVQKSERQGVRKIFSLPLLDGPSGGFRLRRSGAGNSKIYQVQAATAQTRGRDAKNINSFVPLPGLVSKSITPAKSGEFSASNHFINAERWFEIPLGDQEISAGVLSASFKLGTKGRPDIRCEVAMDLIRRMTGQAEGRPHEWLKSSLKVVNINLGRMLGNPREGNISVVAIKSESVVIEYVRESRSSALEAIARAQYGATDGAA